MAATLQMALEAAARVAEQAGIRTYILGDSLEGEAREVGTGPTLTMSTTFAPS